jgi:hypothetical protein
MEDYNQQPITSNNGLIALGLKDSLQKLSMMKDSHPSFLLKLRVISPLPYSFMGILINSLLSKDGSKDLELQSL